jgi:hypothetical protein
MVKLLNLWLIQRILCKFMVKFMVKLIEFCVIYG